jgi:hypothetical protein
MSERLALLEVEVATLRTDLDTLKQQLLRQ